MSTLPGRPDTALIVIDVQVEVVAEAHARDAVVANIAALVERAREAGVAVIWVRHHGDDFPRDAPGWPIVPELMPAAGETIIDKRYGDAFEDTELEAVLARLRVGRLVVTGAQTEFCIRCTLHGAFTRGYDVILAGDAHTTDDKTRWGVPGPAEVIALTNLYWTHQAAPGRTAATLKASDVDFAAPPGT